MYVKSYIMFIFNYFLIYRSAVAGARGSFPSNDFPTPSRPTFEAIKIDCDVACYLFEYMGGKVV